MARISRQSCETNFFHVMVQGLKKECIFKNEIYKEKYLNVLLKESQKTNLYVLAYCIMDNHAHILVYTEENINLTAVMQKTNTVFALFYNKMEKRCGYVFRDRYRCESILTQAYLEDCIRYIHNNPVVAGICDNVSNYKFSSYNQYINKNGIINDEIIKLCFHDIKDYKLRLNYKIFFNKFIDIDNEFGENKKDDYKAVIKEIVDREKIDLKNIDEYLLYLLTKETLNRCKVSKKDIANELGIERTKLIRNIKKFDIK